ncbi:MAG: hypothetical protein CSA68_12130 [Rhodobacterales bacterium]|nr:MAG: hypothetical protein CSA68_12130 [Rhodobacterales bacterium]
MMQRKEKRTAFFVYLYMAIIVGIFIALIGYGFSKQYTRVSSFDRSGITVTATYVGGRMQRVSDKPERPPEFQYIGRVQLVVDGRNITADAPVSPEFYRTVKQGDTVRIRYLPEEPETVQIDPDHEKHELGAISIIPLILVGFLSYWLIRKRRAKRAAA